MPDFISKITSNVKYLYVFLVAPVILFQVFYTPPFQTPDSKSNFNKAYLVSQGLVIGQRLNGTSGGYLNDSIISAESNFDYIRFHYNNKLTSDILSKAESYRWHNDGIIHYTFSSFPAVSVYPPFAYLPQAFAIRIGWLFNLSIIDTYRLALLFVSICSIFITYKALALNSRITPVIFATASLPMVTCLYAAIETDALLISIGFLFSAFIYKRFDNSMHRENDITYASLMILFLALQKPPYIGLTLLLFSPSLAVSNSYGFFKRLAFSISIAAAVLSWIVYAKITAWVNINPSHTSLISHIAYLIEHPLAFLSIFSKTIYSQYHTYYNQMIGVLGSLDAQFPKSYYFLASFALIVAALLSLSQIKLTDWLLVLISIFLSIGMIFISLYADWNSVTPETIQGIQGRYFLPLLPLSFAIFHNSTNLHCLNNKLKFVRPIAPNKPSIRTELISKFLISEYLFLYFLFPLLTFIYSTGLIIDRYYLNHEQIPSVTIETSNAEQRAVPISNGNSVKILLHAPCAPYGASQLKVIDILMATYSGSANGIITLRICKGNKCSSSTIDVANQKDNSYFKFKLDRWITIEPGEEVNIIIKKQSGTNPAAIWLWKKHGSLVTRLNIGDKVIYNASPRMRFIY